MCQVRRHALGILPRGPRAFLYFAAVSTGQVVWDLQSSQSPIPHRQPSPQSPGKAIGQWAATWVGARGFPPKVSPTYLRLNPRTQPSPPHSGKPAPRSTPLPAPTCHSTPHWGRGTCPSVAGLGSELLRRASPTCVQSHMPAPGFGAPLGREGGGLLPVPVETLTVLWSREGPRTR